MAKRLTSLRISRYTDEQVRQLGDLLQASNSEIVCLAIDRMWRQEYPDRKNPMNYQEMAEQSRGRNQRMQATGLGTTSTSAE